MNTICPSSSRFRDCQDEGPRECQVLGPPRGSENPIEVVCDGQAPTLSLALLLLGRSFSVCACDLQMLFAEQTLHTTEHRQSVVPGGAQAPVPQLSAVSARRFTRVFWASGSSFIQRGDVRAILLPRKGEWALSGPWAQALTDPSACRGPTQPQRSQLPSRRN